MLVWLAAVLLVVLFAMGLNWFKVIATSRQALATSQRVVGTLRDPTMTDLQKEKAMQASSLELFKCFALILLGCALALAVPFAIIWLLDLAGLVSLDAVLALTLSIPFLLATTVIAIVVIFLIRKRTP